jgi:multidrug efflux pump subunit AcrB
MCIRDSNGIVTIENIYRLRSQGMSLRDAAKYGAGEVAWPIISSTATTVAAFAPLLFWKDLMGEFMKYLPLTLIITLSSSLFVALVVNPAIAAKYLKEKEDDENEPRKTTWKFWAVLVVLLIVGVILMINGRTKSLSGQTAAGTALTMIAVFTPVHRFVMERLADFIQKVLLVKLENGYSKFLGFFLRGRKPVMLFAGTLILMVATQMWYFGSEPKVEFFPETDPKYVNVFIEMPIGTDIEDTDAMTKKVETAVFEVLKPDMDIVEAVLSQVGKGTSDPMQGVDLGVNPNKGRVNISFLEFQYRNGKSTWEIMERIREKMREIPGAIISVDKDPTGPPVGYPINIEVSGEEYDQLTAVANTLKQQLTELGVPGVEGLKTDLETGKPELNIYVDRENVRRYGISTAQVATEIRTALFGKEVSKFKQGEDDYPIVIRYDQQNRYDLSRILENKITYQNPSNGRFYQVPISSVARLEYNSSFGAIKRLDMDRVITIYSNVLDGYNATEIVAEYKDYLSNIKLPEGFSVKITGEQQEQEESSEFLMFAFMIALFLVFLIIVAQFNSISSPFIIMFSVLFSTIGVFGGLATFNMPFVVLMTGIGIISLAGVVVNNAIVLIDYAQLLIQRRKAELDLPEEAELPRKELEMVIVATGKTRLRPVLLTAITTVLGLIPLAIGLNIDFIGLFTKHDPNIYIGGDNVAFWGPMSWTVIFGLSFATFLTLVVLPTMFLMVERGKSALKRIFS